MSKNIKITHVLPKAEEYCQLRIDCGLSAKDIDYVEQALNRCLFFVGFRNEENNLIAMTRVVGDEMAAQIVDVCVHPKYQGQKLSSKLMTEIMAFVQEKLPKSCFVNLFADVDFLYKKYGFAVPEKTVGMILK